MRWARIALASLAFLTGIAAPAPTVQPTAGHRVVESAIAMPAASLTKTDVDAWLDGFVPYALKRGGIPGAVVVVVRGGQPLTERGLGLADVASRRPVDPRTTLFRVGSISKTITWTAVMQLVEAGKLDLDRDVNSYLDFRISPAFGRPVTLRNLMTHTAGFADTRKFLVNYGGVPPPPLSRVLKRWVPPRIYPPGEVPAYSNYGAALAGYIVERVSGEPFNLYVRRHIFAPAGMHRSTFEQPLPATLAPGLASGYRPGSRDPDPFEIIPLAPAGALSSTGHDMGRFMIEHLNAGGVLLAPATAALMHAEGPRNYSELPSMALGFYREPPLSLDIIGHGGDTGLFFSDMHLFIDEHVGLFISLDSYGNDAAADSLREQLLAGFVDRYFPQSRSLLPSMPGAGRHARALAGHYISSRAASWSWLRLPTLLGETVVTAGRDGMIAVSTLTAPSGEVRQWREIRPWTWQDVDGTDLLQARVDARGKVKMFSVAADSPIIEYLPAPASLDAGWIVALAAVAFAIVLISAAAWPATILMRRLCPDRFARDAASPFLYRSVRTSACLLILFVVGWTIVVSNTADDLAVFDSSLDRSIRMLQLVLVSAIAATAAALYAGVRAARARELAPAPAAWLAVVALAEAWMIGFAIDAGLLTLYLDY